MTQAHAAPGARYCLLPAQEHGAHLFAGDLQTLPVGAGQLGTALGRLILVVHGPHGVYHRLGWQVEAPALQTTRT